MPRARTSFADFSINPAASERPAGKRKAPTLPELDPAIDPIERKVRTIVADTLGIDFEQATPDSALLHLGADELDVVEICINVEQAFGLEEIDEAHIEGFVRVKDVIAYVRRRQ